MSRRATAVALAVAAVVVALNLVFMMSNGMAARSVAANAYALHWTNSMLGSAAIARAANAQAVVFAVDHQLGVASDSALQTATDEARRAFNAATTTLEGRPTAYDTTVIDPALDRYVEINDNVLDLIEGGQVDEAVSLSQEEFEVASSFARC